MNIIHSLENYKYSKRAVVSIGTFDGVHIGHRQIIRRLVAVAKKQGQQAVLLTFFPHPRMVLQKEVTIKLINTIDQRIALLQETGLDTLVIHPFDKSFSQLSASDFIRTILVGRLKVSTLIVGYDHHFGKNKAGNLTQLTEYSRLYNFEVEEISAQEVAAVSVSATKIRKALINGDISTANSYLSYSFMLSGTVVDGKKLGRTLGFPTANICIEAAYKLIPKEGIYVVKSVIDTKTVFGMMNIGSRPTVDGKDQTIEVHFFDFDKNIYNQKLTVALLHFLREEQKFDSIVKLTQQLNKDKEGALLYLKKRKY